MHSPSPAPSSASGFQRRTFLKGMLGAGAGSIVASSPLFAQARKSGAKAAGGDKVRLACCGIGNRGADDVNSLHATGLCTIVALCDVDMGAPHTLGVLKKFPDVPRFQDFRKMLEKMDKEIDAVSIGVPDFAHFPIAMLAMSMGKHVYVEKPMAHTFQEVELMMLAEKKYKVAAQMGNQGHSDANYFQFKAWTDAGIIKNVTKITAFMNSSRRWHGMKVAGYLPEQPVPASLDWDTWLGTAQPNALRVESRLSRFWIKNTGTKTVRKLIGMVISQSITTNSVKFQRLSTPSSTTADNR